MRQFRLFFYFLIILAFGCECPPEAITPKEITPSEYAKITILNAIYSHEFVNIETKYGIFLKSLSFGNHSEINKIIGSGNNILKLINPDNDYFYLVPLYLKKDISYLAVIAGNEIDMSTILIENDYSKLDRSKQYVRIINAMKIRDKLQINFNGTLDNEFTLGEYTDFQLSTVGFNDMMIVTSDNQAINYWVDCKPNKVYTVVLYYAPNGNSDEILNIRVIEENI